MPLSLARTHEHFTAAHRRPPPPTAAMAAAEYILADMGEPVLEPGPLEHAVGTELRPPSHAWSVARAAFAAGYRARPGEHDTVLFTRTGRVRCSALSGVLVQTYRAPRLHVGHYVALHAQVELAALSGDFVGPPADKAAVMQSPSARGEDALLAERQLVFADIGRDGCGVRMFVRCDVRAQPLAVGSYSVSRLVSETGTSVQLLLLCELPPDACLLSFGFELHGLASLAVGRISLVAIGGLAALHQPAAALSDIQLANLCVLARVYCYLRHFHASDECAHLPSWEHWLDTAAAGALECVTPDALLVLLQECCYPIAPTLCLFVVTDELASHLRADIGLWGDVFGESAADAPACVRALAHDSLLGGAGEFVRVRHHSFGDRDRLLSFPDAALWSSRRTVIGCEPRAAMLLAQDVAAEAAAGARFVLRVMLRLDESAALASLASHDRSSASALVYACVLPPPTATGERLGTQTRLALLAECAVDPASLGEWRVLQLAGLVPQGVQRFGLAFRLSAREAGGASLRVADVWLHSTHASLQFANMDLAKSDSTGVPLGWTVLCSPQPEATLAQLQREVSAHAAAASAALPLYDVHTEPLTTRTGGAGGASGGSGLVVRVAVLSARRRTATEVAALRAKADGASIARNPFVDTTLGRGLGVVLPLAVRLAGKAGSSSGEACTVPPGDADFVLLARDPDAEVVAALGGEGVAGAGVAAAAAAEHSAAAERGAFASLEERDALLRQARRRTHLYLPSAESRLTRLTCAITAWALACCFHPACIAEAALQPGGRAARLTRLAGRAGEWVLRLRELLADAALDEDSAAFAATLAHFAHSLRDGLCTVQHVSRLHAAAMPPVLWRWDSEASALIITGVEAAADAAGVRIGDRVVAIDGIPSAEVLQNTAAYVSASTSQHLRARVLASCARGSCDSALGLSLARANGVAAERVGCHAGSSGSGSGSGGKHGDSPSVDNSNSNSSSSALVTVQLPRIWTATHQPHWVLGSHVACPAEPVCTLNGGSAFYADPSRLSDHEWLSFARRVRLGSGRACGVVVDLRRPLRVSLESLVGALCKTRCRSPLLLVPAPSHPFDWRCDSSRFAIEPLASEINLAAGGVCVAALVGATTCGATELAALMLRTNGGATLVGASATAGAAGATNAVLLPGGFVFEWGALAVFADDSEAAAGVSLLHGCGVPPDVCVASEAELLGAGVAWLAAHSS